MSLNLNQRLKLAKKYNQDLEDKVLVYNGPDEKDLDFISVNDLKYKNNNQTLTLEEKFITIEKEIEDLRLKNEELTNENTKLNKTIQLLLGLKGD